MPFDAFISYSSNDKLIADAACATLESRGIRCWIAPRDILPGQEWPAAIVKGIEQSRIMVLIYSGSANESPQIKRELERAVHANMPILPFRIEAAPMSPSLEYLISTPHWLDAMTPPMEGHMTRLGETVSALLGGLEGQPIKRRLPPPPVARSARGRLVVAAAVLLVAAGAGVWAVWPKDKPAAGPTVASTPPTVAPAVIPPAATAPPVPAAAGSDVPKDPPVAPPTPVSPVSPVSPPGGLVISRAPANVRARADNALATAISVGSTDADIATTAVVAHVTDRQFDFLEVDALSDDSRLGTIGRGDVMVGKLFVPAGKQILQVTRPAAAGDGAWGWVVDPAGCVVIDDLGEAHKPYGLSATVTPADGAARLLAVYSATRPLAARAKIDNARAGDLTLVYLIPAARRAVEFRGPTPADAARADPTPPPADPDAAAVAKIRGETVEGNGDTFVREGKHAEAVLEYEAALREYPGLPGVAQKLAAARAMAARKSAPPATPPADPADRPPVVLEPLIFAAVKGTNLKGADAIIKASSKAVSERDAQGRTPLHVLAASPDGAWQMARLLLDNGADADATDGDGQTPMQAAVASGNTKVKAILDQIATTRPSTPRPPPKTRGRTVQPGHTSPARLK